jgi:hypothetical protein
MKYRRYGICLAVVAFLGGALLVSPGCSACPDIASKICDKACTTCGKKCTFKIAGEPVNSGSNVACVSLYTPQCLNQPAFDADACSTALDTAQCDEDGAVLIPTECTSTVAGSSSSGGGSGSSSGSSDASSSSSGGTQ